MTPRVIAAAIFTFSASPAPAAAAVQDEVIVVQANVAQREIERILNLDNLEVELLPAREVAAAMAAIHRGRAPRDFWAAYQSHVKAWQRYAKATDSPLALDAGLNGPDAALKAEAKLAIDSTFDEVERIARRYGAKIPAPRKHRGY